MQRIPEPTIKRLIRYYRCLSKLDISNGEVILSLELGRKTGVTAAQVRKDLSYLGELGQKGVGYEITTLKKSLGQTLGFDRSSPIIIVGAGNLGRALCCYKEFDRIGIKVSAIFDNDLNKINNQVNGLKVRNIKKLEPYVKKNDIKIAALTVPESVVEQIYEKLIGTGINYIWNFAPVSLPSTGEASVFYEDLASDLGSLIYQINNKNLY